jgi:hypothetical protein
MLYYRYVITNLLTYIIFLSEYIIPYYWRRILYLIFIGSRYENIWPYKKYYRLGEAISVILMELAYFIGYIILFYDNKPIKEIIKSRLYVLGENWFLIELVIILMVIFIWNYD